jgi:nitrite reductase/ring-hydroxylating ferredoxin subunit
MAGMELRSLAVGHGSDRFPILIVRWKDSFRAFVNACPHHYLPLDARSGHVLSACGKLLRCTNHDAAFRIADGVCVAGLAMGSSLDRIPLHIDLEGWLCIAETEA